MSIKDLIRKAADYIHETLELNNAYYNKANENTQLRPKSTELENVKENANQRRPKQSVRQIATGSPGLLWEEEMREEYKEEERKNYEIWLNSIKEYNLRHGIEDSAVDNLLLRLNSGKTSQIATQLENIEIRREQLYASIIELDSRRNDNLGEAENVLIIDELSSIQIQLLRLDDVEDEIINT